MITEELFRSDNKHYNREGSSYYMKPKGNKHRISLSIKEIIKVSSSNLLSALLISSERTGSYMDHLCVFDTLYISEGALIRVGSEWRDTGVALSCPAPSVCPFSSKN